VASACGANYQCDGCLFQSLLHQGTSSNTRGVGDAADGTRVVSIPSSSGHFFERFYSQYLQLRTQGFNPFFIRALLRTYGFTRGKMSLRMFQSLLHQGTSSNPPGV